MLMHTAVQNTKKKRDQPQVNEVAQIDHEIRVVTGTAFDWHIQSSLTKKSLTIWRHVTQIVDDNEHLNHCFARIEQSLKT